LPAHSVETDPGPAYWKCREPQDSPEEVAGTPQFQVSRGASLRTRFRPGFASDNGVVNSTPTAYFGPSRVQYRTEAVPKVPYCADSKETLVRVGTGSAVSRRAPSSETSRH